MTPKQEVRKMRTFKEVLSNEIGMIDLINKRIRKINYEKNNTEQVIRINNNTIDARKLELKKLKANTKDLKIELTKIKNTIKEWEELLEKETERMSLLVLKNIKSIVFYDINNNTILGTHNHHIKNWKIGDIYVRCGVQYEVVKVKTEEIFSGKALAVFVGRY